MSGRLISIHAPPRGATSKRTSTRKQFLNFNSRPSARGDYPFTDLHEDVLGSSHAPPGGGTTGIPFAQNVGQISIHAPPRGATDAYLFADLPIIISIHAPPRGATPPGCLWRPCRRDFNSRPSARGDQTTPTATLSGGRFHSRPSAGGDKTVNRAGPARRQFQFTPLREGRQRRKK